MVSSKALCLLALVASAAIAVHAQPPGYVYKPGSGDPPPGTNCHRSCYTLPIKIAIRLKSSYFRACKSKGTVVTSFGGNPKKKDRSKANAYGCGSVIWYKFKNWGDLVTYQLCEHTLATYISQLRPYKISLPKGVQRDFAC